MSLHRVQVRALDFQRRHLSSAFQRKAGRQPEVVRDRVKRLNWVFQQDLRCQATFDQRQHQGRGTEAHQGGGFRQRRITNDDVQPAVQPGFSVWFVARVNNGPAQGRLQSHALFEEVGA